MWKMLTANLVLVAALAPASLAGAQTPQATQASTLRAAVIAPPATPASADLAARNTADTVRPAPRLDTAHLANPPATSSAPVATKPLRLRPPTEDVDVDFTFDSADPLDGRYSGDRPGLMGFKGKVKF